MNLMFPPTLVSYLFSRGARAPFDRNTQQRVQQKEDAPAPPRGPSDVAEALIHLTRAAEKQPHEPSIHAALARAHEAQGAWGKAIAAYRQVLRLQADYPGAARRLAQLYELDEGTSSDR